MKNIKVAMGSKDSIPPTRKHPTDAGMDLYCNEEDVVLPPHGRVIIHTDTYIQLEKGYVGFIWPKSKSDNLIGAGVVDSDYQGEILIKVVNPYSVPFTFTKGSPIAQLVIQAVFTPTIEIVNKEDLYKDKTERGSSGGIVTQSSQMFIQDKLEIE
jgi:dUTP pyrophosphatase